MAVMKWLLFAVEAALLVLLCLVVFLVPVPPFPGKAPQELGVALLSLVTALLCGTLFARASRKAASVISVLLTPPCVICACVLFVVAVPITMGFLRAR